MSNTYDMLLVPEERIDDIIPYDNQIVIRVEFPQTKTKGGIIMTQGSVQREIAQRIIGHVIKIGPDVEFCKVGDDIIYAKYAGTVVSRKDETEPGAGDGYEVRIIEEKQLVAKLAKGDK